MHEEPNKPQPRAPWVAWAIGASAVLAALAFAHVVVLLGFAAVVLAVFLRGAADWVAARTRLSPGLALAAVLVALFGLSLGFVALLVPAVEEQLADLSRRVPEAVGQLERALERTDWGSAVRDRLWDLLDPDEGLLANARLLFGGALGFVGGGLMILFVGIYLAAESRWYTDGLLRLWPPGVRERRRAVLEACAQALRGWVLAQAVSMAVLGVASYIGLTLLGIPLPLLLALLTAALTFIPYLGPLISVIPPILLALALEPVRAIWVALFYLVLQNVEGYLLTPMVQRKAIRLPPALLLFTQVLFATLFGFVGVLIAAPWLVATLAFVRIVYVEEALEHRAE